MRGLIKQLYKRKQLIISGLERRSKVLSQTALLLCGGGKPDDTPREYFRKWKFFAELGVKSL